MTKKCGDCTACCRSLKISELNLGVNEECPNACRGCNIYDSRPESCRSFQCAWLLDMEGFKEESMRPDRSGVLMAIEDNGDSQRLLFFETWAGSIEESRFQELVSWYNATQTVVIVPHEGNKGKEFPVIN